MCPRRRSGLAQNDIRGEVIIADNGSTDGSQDLARRAGARVVTVERKGYGSALMGEIACRPWKIRRHGHADDSYDFGHVPRLSGEAPAAAVTWSSETAFSAGIQRRLPPLHRYLGNPVLSGIGRLFFKSPCGDFHCGLRIFKNGHRSLGSPHDRHGVCQRDGGEGNPARAALGEVPTTLRRRAEPTAASRSWRDGWRHLRFLLFCSVRGLAVPISRAVPHARRAFPPCLVAAGAAMRASPAARRAYDALRRGDGVHWLQSVSFAVWEKYSP